MSASDADKNSFKEIVDLINTVDTENDDSFAGYVLSNNNRSTDIESSVIDETTRSENVEGALVDLTTENKTNLVSGINELELNHNNYVVTNDSRSTDIETSVSDET